jgi:hypothetical protein
MSAERPWSVTVRLDEVPESGRHVSLDASAETRAALAAPARVDAVERLTATFDLTRRGRDGLHVEGRVNATVRQTCVVSLEPVVNTIDEAIDVDFVPPRDGERNLSDEIELDSSADDEPEPMIGNSVDLGLLATEFLLLGIDPYPRKPDAAFEAPASAEAAGHPFAALAAWSKKGTVKE